MKIADDSEQIIRFICIRSRFALSVEIENDSVTSARQKFVVSFTQ
jgi:hypothetical protein